MFDIKDISPKIILVPIFINIAIPMVNKNSRGSSHEVVETISTSITIGSSISIAFNTSDTDIFCVSARLMASPDVALFSPITSYSFATVLCSLPLSISIVKRALPSL